MLIIYVSVVLEKFRLVLIEGRVMFMIVVFSMIISMFM